MPPTSKSASAVTARSPRPRRAPIARGRGRAAAKPAAGELPPELGDEAMAQAEAPRRRSVSDDKGGFLATYFRDMAALDVLKPEEEFAHARRIEGLEVRLWAEMLSHAPMTGYVLEMIEACLDNSLTEFRSLRRVAQKAKTTPLKANLDKLSQAAERVAGKLRALDTDRIHLEAVLDEIAGLAAGRAPRLVRSKLPQTVTSASFRGFAARVEAADRAAHAAREAFVLANLRLVVSIARRFNHGRMALADLIQEGNIGLMKAVERYDYRRGFRFSTYASWWIRHAISRALADKGREVRLPVHMIDAYHRIAKARRELTAKLGRQPTSEELAGATSIASGKIEKMRTYLTDQPVSLDRPVGDDDGRQFVDFLIDPTYQDGAPADRMATEQMTGEVERLLGDLKPIEQDILRQRFGFADDRELTLKEIGEKYNLSRERIRQLQEQALDKMRRALEQKAMM